MQQLEIESSETGEYTDDDDGEEEELHLILNAHHEPPYLPRKRTSRRRLRIGIFFFGSLAVGMIVFLFVLLVLAPHSLPFPVNEDNVDDLYRVDSTLLELDCQELVSDTHYFEDSLRKRMHNREQRCLDTNTNTENNNNKECPCPDPSIPSKYDEQLEWWDRTRKRNVYLLQPHVHDNVWNALDVVLVGDSLTEHWQGTHFSRIPVHDQQGRGRYQPINDVFTELFGSRGVQSVQGIPLGIGEGGYSQLLYRIKDGELRGDTIVAPVVWITIGVYDIQKRACTPEAVLAGTIEVVQAILSSRYQPTRVVINSILPVTRKHTLARQVNELLHCYAEVTPHVEFFDATALFMIPGDVLHRNITLFQDAMHPNVEGYRIWGHAIVHRVQQILEEMKVEIRDWKMADGGP